MAIKETPSTEYSKLLQDPRWQKKRLKIMERDKFSCQVCCATDETLHVHHRYYKNSEGPWDYPDRALVTLCKTCHEMHWHGALSGKDHLIAEILGAGAFYQQMNELANAFSYASNLSSFDFKAIANIIGLYATSEEFRDMAKGFYMSGFKYDEVER